MGGYGSGRQKGYNRKQTVEESLVLDLQYILKDGLLRYKRSLSWTDGSTVAYYISDGNGKPTLVLEYVCNKEPVNMEIAIAKVPQPYGGFRYWMECPLRSGSVQCNNRCLKLYLPPGAKYFGCRKCNDLSYYSCNSSHKFDSYYKDFVQKYGPYPRKKFNEEFSGKWYYRYFRTRKAAKKWYAKMQMEKEYENLLK